MKSKAYSFFKPFILVILFGGIYMDLEIVFRAILGRIDTLNGVPIAYASMQGWTSLWMAGVGGVSGLILGWLNEFRHSDRYKWPWYHIHILLGVTVIYSLEYLSGYILNIKLGLNVWEYNDPLNINHQITALYIPVWVFMSVLAQWLDDIFRHLLFKEEWPGGLGQAISSIFKTKGAS
jgi:hypothetical protein